MAKQYTIKVPVKLKRKQTVADMVGRKVIFSIAGERIPFLIHKRNPASPVLDLTHWASGLRMGCITEIRTNERATTTLNYVRKTDRQAAQAVLDGLIDRHGADHILKGFKSVQVINEV